MVTKLKRKEKFIVEQIKGNSHVFTVKFAYMNRGKRETYTKSFTSTHYDSPTAALNAACEHRDIMRAQLVTIGLPDRTVRTLNEVLSDYYKMMHITQGNMVTLNSYYNHYIKEDYGEKNVADITTADIQENLNSVRFNVSQNMLSRLHGLWRSILSTAKKENLIKYNPADDVEMPKSKKPVRSRNQRVSEDGVMRMVNYYLTTGKTKKDKFNNEVKAYLIMLMYETGMRPAEAFALTRDCISLENREIYVRQAIGSTDKEMNVVVATKTPQSVRTIPMTTQCEQVCQALLNHSANEFLFADFYGKLLDPHTVSKHMRTVSERMGIDFHLYMLRHHFGTELVNTTGDIRTTMALMGHKNSDTTVKYVTTTEEAKRNNMKLVEKSRNDK